MANLKYKTRGDSAPQRKPRVYLCCHSEDFNKYFEVVSNEILAKHNCAIWYIDEAVDRGEDFFADLKQMQLFVMPVTTNLLCTENEALDIEFKFAVENHIPVLPLMQERGLEELFNKKCGDLQFLDKNNNDITAISYDEKLQKYLGAVLVGDEIAGKIRSAFDAYIFLSYRKKDRKYAQELMRLIHKNEQYRDIAIWYDEFLIPGENFNDSIEEALEKSDLFVLTVTPNLINEMNYVMTIEYPEAKRKGKPILPVELVPTDKKILLEKYEDIPNPTDAYNDTELKEALLESIKKMKVRNHDISSEHNFFIGLAYLDGIDVEVNYERAVSLISSSAQDGLVQAMGKMVDIYRNGKGVKRDYIKAIEWQKKKIEQMMRNIEACADQSNFSVFNEMLLLGDYYKEISDYKKAEEEYKRAYEFASQPYKYELSYKVPVENRICECEANGKLMDLLLLQEKTVPHAKSYCRHYIDGYEKLFNETKDERFAEKIAYGCMRLGDAYYKNFEYEKARPYYERCDKYAKFRYYEAGDLFARQLILGSYIGRGNLEIENANYGQAEAYYMRALSFASNIDKEESTFQTVDDLVACSNALSKAYLLEKSGFLACMYSSRALKYAEKMFNDFNTYYAKNKLAECYYQYARCLIMDKRYDEARAILKKTRLINDELLLEGESPQIKMRDSDIYECWGEIYCCENNNEQALLNFKKCLNVRREYSEKGNTYNTLISLAKAYCNMAKADDKYGIYTALDMYDLLLKWHIGMKQSMPRRQFMDIINIIKDYYAVDIGVDLKNAAAEDYIDIIQQTYMAVADEYMLKGDKWSACAFLLRVIKIKEALREKNKDAVSKRDLTELYFKIADVYEKLEMPTESKKYKGKGINILMFS